MHPSIDAVAEVNRYLSVPTLQIGHLAALIDAVRDDFLAQFTPAYHGPYPEQGTSIPYMRAWNAALHREFFRGEMIFSSEKGCLVEEEAFTLDVRALVLDHANVNGLTSDADQQSAYRLLQKSYSGATNLIRLVRFTPRLTFTVPRLDGPRDFYGKVWDKSHYEKPDTVRAEIVRSYFGRQAHELVARRTYRDKRKMAIRSLA